MPVSELLSAIPVAGAFGSAALQQHYALKNWNRQNEYNSWEQQIARLKRANLPLAALLGGVGGSGASSISTPNVDPSLGTAEGVQAYMQNRMQKKQMELLENQIYTEKGRGKKEWTEALRAKTQADKEMNQVYGYELVPEGMEGEYTGIYDPVTNQVAGLRRGRKMQELDIVGREVANNLRNIDLQNAPEKIRAEIDDILTRITRGNLEIKRDQTYYDMVDAIAKDMQKGGTGWQGIKRLITAWFYKMAIR